jgi:site-specific recombinase XerD
MLRHAWATSLAGVADLAVVKELIGHRQLETTARYLHPEWDRLREAIDRAYLDAASLDRAELGDEC